jgi:hypothetical protein
VRLGVVVVSGFVLACGGLATRDRQEGEPTGGTGSERGGAAGESGPGTGGGGSQATGGVSSLCRSPELEDYPPPFEGCASLGFPWLCPHDRQLNIPDYGAFTGCCPPSLPYSCPNGTPTSCFASAEEARASCTDDCVACVRSETTPGGGNTGMGGGGIGSGGFGGAGMSGSAAGGAGGNCVSTNEECPCEGARPGDACSSTAMCIGVDPAMHCSCVEGRYSCEYDLCPPCRVLGNCFYPCEEGVGLPVGCACGLETGGQAVTYCVCRG